MPLRGRRAIFFDVFSLTLSREIDYLTASVNNG
jgi:hypothetical protein